MKKIRRTGRRQRPVLGDHKTLDMRTQCPWCDHQWDAIANANIEANSVELKPGDIMMCSDCQQPGVWTRKSRFRRMTRDELLELEPELIDRLSQALEDTTKLKANDYLWHRD